MKEKKEHNNDPWLQAWEDYNRQAKLSSSLTEEELMRLFTDSQNLPPVPVPPLPESAHPSRWLRFAAVIVLIVVGALLLLLNHGTSDAGTPLISDPGQRVVMEATGNGFNVVPLSGCNAMDPSLASGDESPSL